MNVKKKPMRFPLRAGTSNKLRLVRKPYAALTRDALLDGAFYGRVHLSATPKPGDSFTVPRRMIDGRFPRAANEIAVQVVSVDDDYLRLERI